MLPSKLIMAAARFFVGFSTKVLTTDMDIQILDDELGTDLAARNYSSCPSFIGYSLFIILSMIINDHL